MELFGSNIFSIFGSGRQQREVGGTAGTVAVPGVPSTTDPAAKENQVKPTDSGGSYEANIVYARNPQTALTVSAVYRAVELRAKTIGQMQMQYQMRSSEGGNFVPSMWGMGKRLNYLLQVEPNPIMTASSLWEQVTIHRLMLGNGFIYIERDMAGEPVHLWLALCGGYNYASGTYNLSFMTERGPRIGVNVPREDVLHFPNTFREDNGFWGKSTLQYAFETLSLIKTESQQALETAAKGGRMKLIISEEKPAQGTGTLAFGMFSKDAGDAYAKEVQKKWRDQDVIALRGMEHAQPISLSAQDMQMIEILGMSYDDVARFFGTPRPLLMMDTNSHYTTYTNATMEYLQRTIAPDGTEMENECFRKLLSVDDYGKRRIHLCEQPLLRMDKEAQAKVDQLMLQNGTKTINEIRAEHDMPSVEDGNETMASANLMTLKALIAKGEAATELEPGTYTVKSPKNNNDEEGK